MSDLGFFVIKVIDDKCVRVREEPWNSEDIALFVARAHYLRK